MSLPTSQSLASGARPPARSVRRLIAVLCGVLLTYMLLSGLATSQTESRGAATRSRIDTIYSKLAAGLPETPEWMRFPTSAGVATGTRRPYNRHRTPRPRAAFVSLVRESSLDALLQTMRDVQWAFNDDAETNYDYILFSEKPFTTWFQDRINNFLQQYPNQPKAHFGVVPAKDWDPPAGIDFAMLWHRWMRLKGGGIPYAMSRSYRQMCRFYSGALYWQPLMQDIDYYWRIEPETRHTCRFVSHWRQASNGKLEWVERDPFRYMRDNKKKYAFTISLMEYKSTVRSLMARVNVWREANPQYVAKDNLFKFVSNDNAGFNRCHFWSNFEIADLSFFRSEAYKSYFAALEKTRGFFVERWGDAPVHSIAASLLLNKSEIWHVDYAGYYHPPYATCPFEQDPGSQCGCDPQVSIEYEPSLASCQYKFDEAMGNDPRAIVQSINGRNGFVDSNGHNHSATLKEGKIPVYEIPLRLMRAAEIVPSGVPAVKLPQIPAFPVQAPKGVDEVPAATG